MNLTKTYKYFIESSERDNETSLHFYKTKQYMWALFVGHLSLEKLLKAFYISKTDKIQPYTHNLLLLAEKSGLVVDKEKEKELSFINRFNINARYDDYKNDFYKTCTKNFAKLWMEKIKSLRIWIKSQQ